MASVGLLFMPTDEELLNYLRKKVNGEKVPTDVFTECNIYGGVNREPWKLFDKSLNQTLYVFTPLNKKSKSRIDRVAGSGFWDCKSTKDQVKGLGFKKYFIFKNHPRNTENGNWVMHEFSLPNDDSYVLCKIRNKDPTTDFDDDDDDDDDDGDSYE